MTILFYDPWRDNRIVGRWHRHPNGTITADPQVQDILRAARNWNATDDAAWAFYRSWSNGYLASREIEDDR